MTKPSISTSVVSIIRVHANSSLETEDPTWNYVMIMIWSTLEGNIGIVCACCPVMAPLIRQCSGSRSPSADVSARSSLQPAFWRPRPSIHQKCFNRLEEDTGNLISGGLNTVHIEKARKSTIDDSALELNTIHVTRNVDVERAVNS